MARRRLEDELVRRGLVSDREAARDALSSGRVLVDGNRTDNPATMVAAVSPVRLSEGAIPFVSRGGLKLRAALDRFEVDPTGLDCLDAGASTGGFTDCLLKAGAARVIAADVSYGQLDWSLRNDPRVSVMERTNVRSLAPEDLPFAPELIVADLSFISLGSVIGALTGIAARSARLIALVKPQFEAPASEVEPGGLVKDPGTWRSVLVGVQRMLEGTGWSPAGVMASPITGAKGNVEFLMTALRPAPARGSSPDIVAAVLEGSAVAT